MQRFFGVAFISLVISGSASASEFERNVLLGTGLGAGVGALIGSATGPGGAAVGAKVGGVSGGVIVFLIRPDGCYIQNRGANSGELIHTGSMVGTVRMRQLALLATSQRNSAGPLPSPGVHFLGLPSQTWLCGSYMVWPVFVIYRASPHIPRTDKLQS